MDNRLAPLRRLLRIHINWLTVKLLGKELVSKEELAELKDYGRLSLGDEVGLVERSFILGRTSATGKKSEYKDLTLDKLSRLQKRKFSSAEQLALREAKLHTARRIQALADDAAAGASSRVNRATQELLTDATVKEILEDEIAIALAEKKSRQELASSVGNALGRDLTSGLKKLMVSEMHRAKTRGVAMAIANKVDIYSSSEGVESTVSVVPNRDACEDCRNLYLTDTGNPRIFKLSDLVGQGSNSDEGVSHSRKGGLHLGWKPVLPPAHPNCYCELTYVPPGMAWVNGRLKVTDELRYKNQISKAVDKGTMSATITPKGPPSAQSNDAPKIGNVKGISDPGHEGRPPSAQTTAEAVMPAAPTAQAPAKAEEAPTPDNKVGCPYGGDQDCRDHGGNGAKMHDPNGESMEEHKKHKDFKQRVEDSQKDPQQLAEEHLAQMITIEGYSHDGKTDQKTLDHAENGEIISQKNIGEVEGAKKGVTEGTQKCGIKGNGHVCTKPEAEGMEGQDVQNEQTAFRSFTLFGSNLCPVTGKRMKDGKLNSSQAWCNDHSPAALVTRSIDATEMIDTLKAKSPNWEKVRGQLEEMTVNDLVICNTDRHLENFLLNDEIDDIRVIDHGYSFGKGFNSLHVEIFEGFNSKKMHLRLDETLNERFSNTSFGDMKRAYGDDTLEWKTAQSYMRMRYIQNVASENEGRLPIDDFAGFGGSIHLTANDKFEKFVHNFIDNNIDDPSSPDHATATHFAREGILMPVASIHSDAENRQRGNHLRYEMASRRYIAEKEQAQRGEKSFMADARKEYDAFTTALREEYNKETDVSVDEALETSSAAGEALREYNEYKRLVEDARASGTLEGFSALEEKMHQANENYRKWNDKRKAQQVKEQARYLQLTEAEDEAKDRIFGPLNPPGQERAFGRIRAQLDNLTKPVRQRKPIAAPPEAAIAESAAIGIERRKREAAAERMSRFEQALKDKLKEKGG